MKIYMFVISIMDLAKTQMIQELSTIFTTEPGQCVTAYYGGIDLKFNLNLQVYILLPT